MGNYLNVHILVKSLIHDAPTIINKSKKFGVTGHDARHVVGDLKYFFPKDPIHWVVQLQYYSPKTRLTSSFQEKRQRSRQKIQLVLDL